MKSAMTLLGHELEIRRPVEAVPARTPRWRVRLARWTIGLLAVLLAAAAAVVWFAKREYDRAQVNLALATQAVEESLAAADRDSVRAGADVAQFQAFRRDVLAKAEHFYRTFLNQPATTASSRFNVARAHLRLAQIHRMREQLDEAVHEYREGIAKLQDLARRDPQKQEYPAALAEGYAALADTLRAHPTRAMDAEHAYGNAFDLQQRLVQEHPENAAYPELLARILYNRGRLRAQKPGGSSEANVDYRESIRLLEPLSAASDLSARELARVYDSLGGLLYVEPDRAAEAQALWEKAIGINERLVIKDPTNREAKLELARYCNNLATLLSLKGEVDESDRRSRMALGLMDSLTRVAPSLEIERADAHKLRGLILQARAPQEAVLEYEQALDMFEPLLGDRDLQRLPEFHRRYADLMLSLAAFPKGKKDSERARQLLTQAIALYAQMTGGVVASGTKAAVENTAETIARVLPGLPAADQAALSDHSPQLQRKLAENGAR
jgi:hypothetical protein